MTLEEMSVEAYRLTEVELKQFYKVISEEYATAIKAMKVDLEKLYAQILSGVKPADYYNVVLKTRRLENLVLRVQDYYIEAAKKAGTLTEQASRLAMSNSFYRQQYGLAFAQDSINPVRLSFTALNQKVIEISVVGTPEVWRGITNKQLDKLGGKWGPLSNYATRSGTLTELLLTNQQTTLLEIRRALTKGLIQGKSYRQTAKVFQNVMETSLWKAKRIVRTESHRSLCAGDYANIQSVKVNQGVDVRRQILSTLDDRTREQSVRVDTKLENKDGVFVYPGGIEVVFPGNSGIAKWDINDREITIPRLEGFPVDERRGRNPVTGKNEVITFKSFPEWAKENGLKRNRYGEYLNV